MDDTLLLFGNNPDGFFDNNEPEDIVGGGSSFGVELLEDVNDFKISCFYIHYYILYYTCCNFNPCNGFNSPKPLPLLD